MSMEDGRSFEAEPRPLGLARGFVEMARSALGGFGVSPVDQIAARYEQRQQDHEAVDDLLDRIDGMTVPTTE